MCPLIPVEDTFHAGFAQGKWTAEFSAFLQTLPNRKEVAACLGVKYSSFDNWVRGIYSFPPDLLPKLYACSGAQDLWAFFLDQGGLMAVPQPKASRRMPSTKAPDIYKNLMDAIESLAKAKAAYDEAKEDGRLEPHEESRITYFLRKAQREEAAIEEDIHAEANR